MPGSCRAAIRVPSGHRHVRQYVIARRRRVVQVVQDSGGRQPERPGQLAGHPRPHRGRDQQRVGIDILGLDGHRQHSPVTADNRAANGRDVNHGQSLMVCHRAELCRLEPLELDQPGREHRQQEGHAQNGDVQAARRARPSQHRPGYPHNPARRGSCPAGRERDPCPASGRRGAALLAPGADLFGFDSALARPRSGRPRPACLGTRPRGSRWPGRSAGTSRRRTTRSLGPVLAAMPADAGHLADPAVGCVRGRLVPRRRVPGLVLPPLRALPGP